MQFQSAVGGDYPEPVKWDILPEALTPTTRSSSVASSTPGLQLPMDLVEDISYESESDSDREQPEISPYYHRHDSLAECSELECSIDLESPGTLDCNPSQTLFDFGPPHIAHNSNEDCNQCVAIDITECESDEKAVMHDDDDDSGCCCEVELCGCDHSIEYAHNKHTSYDEFCDILPSFDWQRAIANDAHYHALHRDMCEEILRNPFCPLPPLDYNGLVRNARSVHLRGFVKRIKSRRAGAFEFINEREVFALKLYTDRQDCQRELKKCYRPPPPCAHASVHAEYEQRLCHFSHWRRVLSSAILKYGRVLTADQTFYHGVNEIMTLNVDPTHQWCGPLSATSDLETARGFASKHGFILKMCSRYPRLGTDYYFEASKISAFPNEDEILIGFFYTRVLRVELGRAGQLELPELNRNGQRLLHQLACFIISLARNNIYSYDENLLLLFRALLCYKADDDDSNDDLFAYTLELNHDWFTNINDIKQKKLEMQKLQQFSAIIPNKIKKYFYEFRRQKLRVLKLDKISAELIPIFYDCRPYRNDLSFTRIYKYSPNITELQLFEEYDVNDQFIANFIAFARKHACIPLQAVKVFKCNFRGPSTQFQFQKRISDSNIRELQRLKWRIVETHQDHSYKFMLRKQ